MLSRDDILRSHARLEEESVEVPELGGDVKIREWRGVERDQWRAHCSKVAADGGKFTEMQAVAAALSLIDEDGNRMFAVEQAANLNMINGRALQRIWEAVRDLNALGAGAIEGKSKN